MTHLDALVFRGSVARRGLELVAHVGQGCRSASDKTPRLKIMTFRFCFSWAVVAGLLAWQPATAAEFYVHPDGQDANPGTLAQPFATVTRAQEAVSPGDTVWLRGGKYVFSGTKREIGILLNKSGQEGKRINYWAYQDETPILDFHQLVTPVRIRGISVKGNWLHLKGLEIRGVQQILTNTNESWGIR
ncbi:MAG: hypothetical protein ABIZ81_11270, partial [Opitutaceae bacterium]